MDTGYSVGYRAYCKDLMFNGVVYGYAKTKEEAIKDYIRVFDNFVTRLDVVNNFLKLKSYKIVEVE